MEYLSIQESIYNNTQPILKMQSNTTWMPALLLHFCFDLIDVYMIY